MLQSSDNCKSYNGGGVSVIAGAASLQQSVRSLHMMCVVALHTQVPRSPPTDLENKRSVTICPFLVGWPPLSTRSPLGFPERPTSAPLDSAASSSSWGWFLLFALKHACHNPYCTDQEYPCACSCCCLILTLYLIVIEGIDSLYIPCSIRSRLKMRGCARRRRRGTYGSTILYWLCSEQSAVFTRALGRQSMIAHTSATPSYPRLFCVSTLQYWYICVLEASCSHGRARAVLPKINRRHLTERSRVVKSTLYTITAAVGDEMYRKLVVPL